MFNISTRLRAALFLSAASATMIGASPASAQQATETVVVTGSRIPTTNLSSPSPLSVETAAQIQQTSAFNLSDVLAKMTGADTVSGITSNTTNGGLGLSEIGLRELGPTRTLVLVDGERLLPVFSGFASAPDLNAVPVAMVDHIEVLRDGASSVYGADAVAGVINIITKKDFEGLQVDADGGVSQHGGGDSYSIGGLLGLNLDRGNVTISLLSNHQSPVDFKDRDWAIDPHLNDPNFAGGSTFRSQLNILQDVNSDTVWNNGVETTVSDPSLGAVPCLTYFPSRGRSLLNAGCPQVVPNATLTTALAQNEISLNSHYDITPDVTFVAQAFFTARDSEQRLRPEPLLGNLISSTNPSNGLPVFAGFMVPVDWPGYSDPNHTAAPVPCKDPNGCILANLTPNQFGPRDNKETSDTYRIRVGFQGNLFSDYHWEVGYVEQQNNTINHVLNSGNWLHLAEATGQMPCLDVPGGCTFNPAFGYATPTTPFNFFNGANTFTPEQVKYLTTTLKDTNDGYENYAYADINGPVFDLPAGTIEASLGAERRFEHLTDEPDSLVQEGFAANPSAATAGGYGVTSVYGELRIPLLKNFPLAESLDVTPSARYDHYSNFGDAKTWKIGADWQVIDDVRLRATYATGFRAPSTAELFGGQGISYVGVSGDPCDSRPAGFNGNANAGTGSLAPGSACFQQLTAQGLTPAQIATYQSPENNLVNDQRGLIVGGNPNLKPELSHSFNVGAVLTPRFVPGFTFTADYYSITITNSILTGGIAQQDGPDLVVNGCYVQQSPFYCAQITRNSSGIFQISSQNVNFGTSVVKGMDLEANYDTNVAGLTLPVPGSFVFDVQATRQFRNASENLDGSYTEFVGTIQGPAEAIQPVWKGQLNLDYVLNDLTVHWDSSYLGDGKDLGSATPGPYGDHLPAMIYHNISFGYDLPAVGPSKASHIIFGINNLFDKDPPFYVGDGTCKCNTLAAPYDLIGRLFYMRLTSKF